MYSPTQVDVEWTRSAISMITDGGMLVFPTANLHYKVDHKNKALTLTNVDQLLIFDSFVVHLQTIATFRLIGYTVNELKSNGGA